MLRPNAARARNDEPPRNDDHTGYPNTYRSISFLGDEMNPRFIIWSSVLVISLVTIGLSIRLLALRGVPLSESLMLRGVSCLFLVIIFAHKQDLSLWPKSVKTQFSRALLAGCALTLFTLSYNWLTASAVSVLSNIDVPLLVVLGPLVGIKASLRARVFSLVSIAFLVWYVLGLEAQTQLFYGLTSLMTACFLLFYFKVGRAR